MALAIGQAFNVAYHEFLKSSGIKENLLQEVEYASILSAQQSPSAEVDPVLHDKTKQVCVIAHLCKYLLPRLYADNNW